MQLQDYIKHLQDIAGDEGADVPLVYAVDDEGNQFTRLHFPPAVGYFNEGNSTFLTIRDAMSNAEARNIAISELYGKWDLVICVN